MRLLAALALLSIGAAPAPMRVFVEQGVAPGKQTEVLMLRTDGAYKGVSSLAKLRRRGRSILDTDKGYWFYCGSWRTLPDGRIAVHRQLVESFSYYPPPRPGKWSTTVFAPVLGSSVARITANGRTYALVARAPLNPGWASSESQACDVSRKREPREALLLIGSTSAVPPSGAMALNGLRAGRLSGSRA